MQGRVAVQLLLVIKSFQHKPDVAGYSTKTTRKTTDDLQSLLWHRKTQCTQKLKLTCYFISSIRL